MKRLAEILLLGCMIMLLMGSDSLDERFERLGSKIMCTCGCSQMLLKCNHVGCPNSDPMIRQLRALVGGGREIANGVAASAQAAAGLQPMSNDDDVLNWFRKNWGVIAVVEPGSNGLELWAWVLPRLVFWLGLGVLVVVLVRNWLSRRSRLAHTPPAPSAKLDPHLEALRDRARRETEI